MKDMILFPEDIDRLNTVLAPLVTKSKLLLAVLINRDGRVLTHQGNLGKVDIVSLAALVAGNTASTLAIANLVGEAEFSAMYHQGKDKNIYIDSIDDNTFLSVVFDDQTNIDRVKVFIRQFERQLKEALHLVYAKDEDQIDLDLDMGNNSFQHIPQESGSPQQRQPSYPQQQQYFEPHPHQPGGTTPPFQPGEQYGQNKKRQHPSRG
ncbi:MAG: roadblock/LC7 domain-containing protein [Chitinispirillaceae bacterium]|nr:roadblock/LC7 domain-containing protein [Chitinispirillaceae bacterium]